MGGGTNAGYWEYPTRSNTINPSMANYGGVVGQKTNVGSYPYPSAYGTFDQGGDVWEWNESVYQGPGCLCRGLRGGSFCDDGSGGTLQTVCSSASDPADDYDNFVRFRVVELVPEPSSIIVLLGGLTGLIGLARRRR